MSTLTKEEQALGIIGHYWETTVAPQVDKRACILAGRLLSVSLSRVGIPVTLYHTDAVAMNELWYELFVKQGVKQEDLPAEAWCVGAVTGDIKGTHRTMVGGFSGHIVATTANYFIDLTAGQFDRPTKGIVTGSPLFAQRDAVMDTEYGKQIPIQQGIYIVKPAQKPASYKWTPDWSFSYKVFATPLVDILRKEMA